MSTTQFPNVLGIYEPQTGDGPFAVWQRACDDLRSQGYSVGFMCGDEPVGVMRGKFTIMKWRNLSADDIAQLDGILVPSGPGATYRSGALICRLRGTVQ